MNSESRETLDIRRRTVAALAVGLSVVVVAGVGSMSSAAPAVDSPIPADFGDARGLSGPFDPCDDPPQLSPFPCFEGLTPDTPPTLVHLPDQPLIDLVATDDSATPTTATTAPTGEQPATTAPTGEPPTTSAGPPPTEQQTSAPALDLQIRSAGVTCEGLIQIAYETVANPDTGILANHLVVLNPVSDPTAFATQELIGRPANGAFVFEGLGAAGETYRAFVVALFDPAVVDGAKLIDEGLLLPAADC